MNSPVSDNNTTPVSDNNTIDPEKTTEGVMNFVNNINAKTGSIANNIGNGARELGNDATNNFNAQREKANVLIADGQLKWSEKKAQAKAMADEKRADFENFKAKRQQQIDRGESYEAGWNELKNMGKNAYQKGVEGIETGKEAGKVMKQAAIEQHAVTASKTQSDAGDLAGQESKSTGGMGANAPMLSSSGAATVGGRRRRRRSRKKKKKSKRKSRRKKTRKRKSRKSRKKRRKKSKKSRRRRRR